MTVALLCGVALSGIPQCSPNLEQCYSEWSDGEYWIGMQQLWEGKGVEGVKKVDRYAADALCSPASWQKRHQCDTDCRLRLRLTAPAEFAGVNLCLNDNEFYQEWTASHHVDLTHPIHGRELSLIAPGKPGATSQEGCYPSDFVDAVAGNIALLRRGSQSWCKFADQVGNAEYRGAAAAIVVDSGFYEPEPRVPFVMEGVSWYFNLEAWEYMYVHIPAQTMPRVTGDVLFEALDSGTRITGTVELNCAQLDADPSPAEGDSCPDTRLRGLCDNRPDDAERLCAKCPLEMRYNATAPPVCLWGHRMAPVKAENALWGMRGRAFNTADREVVVVLPRNIETGTGLPHDGCDEADWDGLAGKIVATQVPTECQPFTALRRAQAAGVAALVLLTPRVGTDEDAPAHLLSGHAHFARIPVHSIAPTEALRLRAAAESHGAQIRTVGHALAPCQFTEGVMPSRQPAGAAALGADVNVHMSLGGEEVTIVCAALAAALATALAIKFGVDHKQNNITQAYELAQQRGGGLRVPLRVASSALSLTLLVAIAAVAFALANKAGSDATDTAMDGMRKAADRTHRSAAENVNDVSGQLRDAIVLRVKNAVTALLDEGAVHANTLAALYAHGLTDDSYASFHQMSEQLKYVDMANERWYSRLHTHRGYVIGTDIRTDDRRSGRADGINESVWENNDGHRYGIVIEWTDTSTTPHTVWPWASFTRVELNISEYAGAGVGDTLGMTRGKPMGYQRWYLAERGWPDPVPLAYGYGFAEMAVSVFQPIVNDRGDFGTVEARLPAYYVGLIIGEMLVEQRTENITLVVFELQSRRIVGENKFYFEKPIASILHEGNVVTLYHLYNLTECPVVELNALGNVLDKKGTGLPAEEGAEGGPAAGGDTLLRTSFDQRDEYSEQELLETSFSVDQATGAVTDFGPNHWSAEMRHVGGWATGSATVVDGERNRRVLSFDGTAALFVYHNLTTDTSSVARYRKPTADGSWDSDHEYYRNGVLPTGPNGQYCPRYAYNRPKYTDLWEKLDNEYEVVESCMLRPNIWWGNMTMTMMVRPAKGYGAVGAVTEDTPVLFSEAHVGEVNMIVYGNGAMVWNVFKHGCKTPPPPGGVPAEAWTTIVVTVSFSRCEMYLNGTKVGSGRLHDDSEVTGEYSAFIVGSKFSGAVDHLSFHRQAAKDAEAADLHQQMVDPSVFMLMINRKKLLPSKVWAAGVERLVRGGENVDGYDWAVAGLAPRDDIMRNVDANNAATQEFLRRNEEHTSDYLAKSKREGVMVIAVVALASVLVFVFFNDAITRPFARVARVMCEAAMMRVDVLPEGSHYISEVDTINNATALMVCNLREFRAYIPPALLSNQQEGDGGCAKTEVAIVFTDIRSSTQLWEKCGEAMATGLKIHNAIIRSRIEEFDGYEIKTIGDAFMTAFSEVECAVDFGLCIQKDLFEATWPEGLLAHEAAAKTDGGAWNGIRIRVGVNWGNAELVQERGRIDYYGPVVNVAARVEAQCIPGAVCVTEAVLEVLCLEEVGDPVVIPMGSCALKGVESGTKLTLLVPQGMDAREAAVREGLAARAVNGPDLEGSQSSAGRLSANGLLDNSGSENSSRSGRYTHSCDVDTSSSSHHSDHTATGGRKWRRGRRGTHAAMHACREFMSKRRCAVARTTLQFPGVDLLAMQDPFKVVQAALSALLTTAQNTNGTVHFFIGAAVSLSWQQLRPTDYVKHAFAFAGTLPDAVAVVDGGKPVLCNAATGVAAGSVLVGNIGSQEHSQRFTTVVGPCFTLAELLCESCAAWKDGQAAGLYAALGEDPALRYPVLKKAIRPVDTWSVETGYEARGSLLEVTVYQIRTETFGANAPAANPLMQQGRALSSAQATDSDGAWGQAYWRAFSGRMLAPLRSADPTVIAVEEMQAQGVSLRPRIKLDVLGLYSSAQDTQPWQAAANNRLSMSVTSLASTSSPPPSPPPKPKTSQDNPAL